jgi:hypothetical protein
MLLIDFIREVRLQLELSSAILPANLLLTQVFKEFNRTNIGALLNNLCRQYPDGKEYTIDTVDSVVEYLLKG